MRGVQLRGRCAVSSTTTYKCDVCSKAIDRHAEDKLSDYTRPPYGWLRFSASLHSMYVDDMSKQVNTDGEVCSPDCARKLLTKTLERITAYEKWAVEEEARQKRMIEGRAAEDRKRWEEQEAKRRKEEEERGPGYRG